ncbi:MAG: DsbA family protein [Candidatus Binatia bacterium]
MSKLRKFRSRRWYLGLACSLWGILAIASTPFAQSPEEGDPLAFLAAGPARGSKSAPVTIIELSDFQCIFCGKFWKETLPRLDAEYIKTGKVRFVYRHLAILGRHSITSAQAADCAGEQGKFWQYHDRLFASMGPFALTNGRLKEYAREIGLDVKAFDQCLDSGKYFQKVRNETGIALSLGARATPVFFINGMMLVGAHPFENFQEIIEEELRENRDSRESGKQKQQRD